MESYRKAVQDDPLNPVAGLHVIFAKFLFEKQKREIERSREIFWITINPKPTVTFEEFKEVICERLTKRVFMKGAVFVFEQRSISSPYTGVHCHMMVDKNMSPKQMFDRVFNTVKDYVGNPKHVDLRSYPYSYREDKLDYMRGRKWDADKDKVIAATIAWRRLNDIPDLFEVEA